jgi:hypothetical protein
MSESSTTSTDRMEDAKVDWESLDDVVWESGGGDADLDVAAALRLLRFAEEDEDGEYGDILTVLLYEHGWSQGRVFPVTAQLIPYVLDIVEQAPVLEQDPAEQEEAARFIPLVAAAAHDRPSPAGQAVLQSLLASKDRLIAWLDAAWSFEAALSMLHVPGLRPVLFEAPHRQALLSAILSSANLADAEARAWAALELENKEGAAARAVRPGLTP